MKLQISSLVSNIVPIRTSLDFFSWTTRWWRHLRSPEKVGPGNLGSPTFIHWLCQLCPDTHLVVSLILYLYALPIFSLPASPVFCNSACSHIISSSPSYLYVDLYTCWHHHSYLLKPIMHLTATKRQKESREGRSNIGAQNLWGRSRGLSMRKVLTVRHFTAQKAFGLLMWLEQWVHWGKVQMSEEMDI